MVLVFLKILNHVLRLQIFSQKFFDSHPVLIKIFLKNAAHTQKYDLNFFGLDFSDGFLDLRSHFSDARANI